MEYQTKHLTYQKSPPDPEIEPDDNSSNDGCSLKEQWDGKDVMRFFLAAASDGVREAPPP